MKRLLVATRPALLLAAGAFLLGSCAPELPPTETAVGPAPPEVSDTVATMNREVRERYAETREKLRGEVDAVLIVGGARMVLRQRGEPEWSKVFNTQLVDQYKTIAHVPLGLYAMALPYADGPASDELRRKAAVYRDKTRAFAIVADQLEIPPAQRPRQHAMLEASLAVLDKLVADGTITRRDLEAFARRMGPLQLANADLAAAIHLDNLAAATAEMRARLKPGQWEKMYVLVTGSKMPRAGNLQYEYFVRLMGRNEIERRLLYTEGLTTPDTAAPLIGTLEIDRSIGQAFFADRYRIDRDLLADGARKHLDQMFGRSTSSPR